MNTMKIEKTLRLEHQNLRAIVPQRKTIDTEDYKVDDFKPSGNNLLDEWRIRRLSEYLTYKFPMWKRTGLKNLSLPNVLPYKGLEALDIEGLNLLETLDFEGADRKFVLFADVFSSSGEYIVVEDDTTIVVNDVGQIDNTLIDVRSGELNFVRIVERPFFIGNLRIKVRRNAKLNLYNLYLGTSKDDLLISNVFIDVENDSKTMVKDFYFGGKINVGYVGVRVNAENAYADVRPYYLGNEKTVIDILYLMRFYKPNSYGNVDAKGVLTDEAKVVFRGIMDILSGAKEVEAHQSNHATLMSLKAKVEAIPSLMVDENDVVASHAASSSPIDENMVFYLMSRGIPKEDAQKMIVRGVFETLKDELKRYNLEGVVEHALDSVLG
ncbi:MAG: SufB/SufD family protein [Fervidobacterium pennivorans]|uniref:SufD family Fe-S cluster assembly protein n=1 Tax=Fervidobacterium pennivorans TaxID=93466 RepID=A0A7C4VVH2_FERPE|nr:MULTISPECIES: SufD family Fe-S cluster assembly protein [Fervidobacterium]MDM7320981.1 SufD family Fe-S cluster assembly protein [Fervidobacterium sp.]NPU90062.1 SufD family Fe-S cluster assembly protein [Fervidobacterium sp.]QIV78660.1 SufD family Fe-S cluster assembly protein [Fervidobacterium pennivorans subsp. keratinolyticus]